MRNKYLFPRNLISASNKDVEQPHLRELKAVITSSATFPQHYKFS